MIRRATVTLLLSLVLLWAAARAMGVPDIEAGLLFLGGGYTTTLGSLAAVELVVWVLVAVLTAMNVVSSMSEARGVLEALRRRRQRALGMLAIGLLALALGVVRHHGPSFSICCGDVKEARDLVR
ncbi:MAG: hypothetical protein ACYDGR_00645 [Candidatus Dormibacteria bacterium]